MAKKCDISAGENEWIRDIFIISMTNSDIQRKLPRETRPPLEALNVALIDEKGITKMKMTNIFKSKRSSLNKPFIHFNVQKYKRNHL